MIEKKKKICNSLKKNIYLKKKNQSQVYIDHHIRFPRPLTVALGLLNMNNANCSPHTH